MVDFGGRVPKIGVMDSGMGGLSVLREFFAHSYDAEFLYFGDLENAPYGEKTSLQVLELTRAVCFYFLSKNVDAILLACNTATSAASANLRKELKIPVFGMEPAIKPALLAHPNDRIALLATSVTHREEKLQGLKADLRAEDRILHLNCDGLARAVDATDLHAATELLEKILVAPKQEGIRALVLGCTHYIFLKNEIQRLYPDAVLYDGNAGTVRHLAQSLNLVSTEKQPQYELVFSGERNQEEALVLGRRFLTEDLFSPSSSR